jgi:hypothetical protein
MEDSSIFLNIKIPDKNCKYSYFFESVIILQKESRVNAEIKTIFICFISIFIFLNIFWVLFVLFTTNQI